MLGSGSRRGCQWESRGELEWLRGRLPEGSEWTRADWQLFSERQSSVSLTTALSLCTTGPALMGLSPSNCPAGDAANRKQTRAMHRQHTATHTHPSQTREQNQQTKGQGAQMVRRERSLFILCCERFLGKQGAVRLNQPAHPLTANA